MGRFTNVVVGEYVFSKIEGRADLNTLLGSVRELTEMSIHVSDLSGGLVDMRKVTELIVMPGDVEELVQYDSALWANGFVRRNDSRMAVLVSSFNHFMASKLYCLMASKRGRPTKVFRDLEDALAWLELAPSDLPEYLQSEARQGVAVR